VARRLEKSKEERNLKKRSLSTHVVTRAYRAPEIILQERHYNSSVDLWSLGCVIVEALLVSDNYKSEGAE